MGPTHFSFLKILLLVLIDQGERAAECAQSCDLDLHCALRKESLVPYKVDI